MGRRSILAALCALVAAAALSAYAGVQIARIDQGVLTYTVVTGAVNVWRGNPEVRATKVRTIRAGQTAPIRAGQWIVEKPGTIHRAANRGKKPIVIYISSLFRNGAPPAIPVVR